MPTDSVGDDRPDGFLRRGDLFLVGEWGLLPLNTQKAVRRGLFNHGIHGKGEGCFSRRGRKGQVCIASRGNVKNLFSEAFAEHKRG